MTRDSMATSADWIEIRRGTLMDVPFIRKLALESVIYGIPSGRDVTNEAVVQKTAAGLKNLELMVRGVRERPRSW